MNTRSNAFWVLLPVAFVRVTSVALALPPQIDSQPQNQTNVIYQPAAFGVIASGTGPLSYQWRKDGTPIPGATNDQLVLTLPKFSDAGNYSVVVANAEATATSSNASLTVNLPKGGDLDFSFAKGGLVDGTVRTIALQSDGKVLIAGFFNAVDSVPRTNVARLNIDGSLDQTFQNGLSGIKGAVYAMKLQPDGKVIVGGTFISVNGVGRTNIARLNSDGSLDDTFQKDLPGTFGPVYSAAIDTNGMILIGGTFGQVNGIARRWIARLNPDGTLDESFQPDLQVFGSFGVACITVQPDGKVLIGGDFTSVNGTTRNRIARLNSDGSLDTGFQNGLSGADNTVYAVAVQSDGKVLIGGLFMFVNGPQRPYMARLNSSGSLDSGFGVGVLRANGRIYSIAVQNDGKIIVGGSFTPIAPPSPTRIARLQANGSALDGTFQNGLSGADLTVYSIALQTDGRILVAGDFTTMNGSPVSRVARLWPGGDIPPFITSINRTGENVSLSWEAIPNRIYRAQYSELLSPTNWLNLSGDIVAPATGIGMKTDSGVGSANQRFYRVGLLP